MDFKAAERKYNEALAYNDKFKLYIITYKYVFIISLLLFIAAAYVYLLNSRHVYQISCSLFISDTLTRQPAGKEDITQHIKAIRSAPVIEQSVNSPAFKAISSSMYNNSLSSLVASYQTHLTVSEGFEPGSVALSLTDTIPGRAEAFLKQLFFSYSNHYKNAGKNIVSIKLMDDTLRILAHRLIALNTAASKKGESIRYNMTPTSLPITLQEKNRRLAALDVIYYYAGKPVSSFIIIPDSYISSNTALQKAITSFNELQLQKQAATGSNSADNSETTALNQQLLQLQIAIKNEISLQRTRLNAPVKVINQIRDTHLSTDPTNVTTINLKKQIAIQIDSFQNRIKLIQAGLYNKNNCKFEISSLNITPVQPFAPLCYFCSVLAGLVLPVFLISYIRNQK